MTTGERIRDARESKGLTQEKLAAKANVAHATVSRLENGNHEGSVKTLRKLAKVLGVKTEELIGGAS